MSTRCRRATATSVVVTVLACGALGAQEAPQVLHDPVDCLVVGKFPSIRACLAPAEEIARGRVYFQPEGLRAWYYVEMSRVDACWAGVLPKPTAQLVGRHVRYYLEALTRAVLSARTPDHDALVVRSEQECRGLVAPWAAAGPRAVFPTLPDGFLLASKGISPLLVAGAGIAVAGTALLVTGGSSAPPATSTPATSTLSPSPTPSPMPSPTPAPSPSPSPTPTPSPTPPAGGPLGVTCAADPAGGPAPLSVRFASTAQGGSGGYVFSWDFGDGTSASQRNPVHVYTAPGRYDPMVRVTSGAE
ncbi:MAG TPA: PKD domain-containing protein, partial [Vicinamibacteria bacterium]